MRENNKKERITKTRCRYDLTKHGVILMVIISLLFIPIFLWLMQEAYNQYYGALVMWFYIGVCALVIVSLIVDIILGIRDYILHSAFNFCIIEDRVCEKFASQKSYSSMCFYIRFEKCDRSYLIPQENYTWSEFSRVCNHDVYSATNIGDEFYVVARKSRDRKGMWVPYMAYNKKFFELSKKSFENRGGIWYVKK